jgi:hypothetical protein
MPFPKVALLLAALGLALAAVPFGPARGQDNLQRLLAADLPRRDGVITLHHSRSAAPQAALYGAEISAAVEWFRARLAWKRHLVVAVLDSDDYRRITPIPYPTPHAEGLTALIIIADHVVAHPGFDRWDLDEVAVNAAWSFHEIGHVIARDVGIASGNAWIDELVASTFMAAYVRAECPQFAGFQGGMPPRFSLTGRASTLAEFDTRYFSIGQWDYLWFHFHFARIADFMARGADVHSLAEGFRREFPAAARRREAIAQTFERLERISPGVTAFAGPIALP